MQQVSVPVINNTDCEGMYRRAGYVELIPRIFICAGYADGKRDSCEVPYTRVVHNPFQSFISFHLFFHRVTAEVRWSCSKTTTGFWAASFRGESAAPKPISRVSTLESPSSGTGSIRLSSSRTRHCSIPLSCWPFHTFSFRSARPKVMAGISWFLSPSDDSMRPVLILLFRGKGGNNWILYLFIFVLFCPMFLC